MENQDEACELQQLVLSDIENDVDETQEENLVIPEVKKPIIENIPKNKISSQETIKKEENQTAIPPVSKHKKRQAPTFGPTMNHLTKINYVNERRSAREYRSGISRNRKDHKEYQNQLRNNSILSEVSDVRNMEKSLIGLLEDFHSGRLKAFCKGCSMEQMTNIREQQESLAKLHFQLGTASISTEQPLSAESLQHSHSTMAQLVEKLEQLSVSIEKLHSSNS